MYYHTFVNIVKKNFKYVIMFTILHKMGISVNNFFFTQNWNYIVSKDK